MKSTFANQRCSKCGSDNLAHRAEWYTEEIPAGIVGHIACRGCHYWEMLVSIAPTKTVFAADRWVVIEAGQGPYRTEAERQSAITFRDPDADQYPRFGITQ